MPFDQFFNTFNDAAYFNRVGQELAEIGGMTIKYLAVDEAAASAGVLADENFKGEYPSIVYRGPYIVKAVINTIPEAAKMWESMGFYSTDTASIIFNKDKIVAEIGRRPFVRDRIYMIYNNTGYEISDVLEQPPSVLYHVQHIQIKLKKLIEGFEDIDILRNFNSAASEYVSSAAAASAIENDILTLNHINDTIESGTSGTGLGNKFGKSDNIFNGW